MCLYTYLDCVVVVCLCLGVVFSDLCIYFLRNLLPVFGMIIYTCTQASTHTHREICAYVHRYMELAHVMVYNSAQQIQARTQKTYSITTHTWAYLNAMPRVHIRTHAHQNGKINPVTMNRFWRNTCSKQFCMHVRVCTCKSLIPMQYLYTNFSEFTKRHVCARVFIYTHTYAHTHTHKLYCFIYA